MFKAFHCLFEDHQDKLEISEGSPPLFAAAPALESRQCLCLHVGCVFAEDPSDAMLLARQLRVELWQNASEAQGYLGDAAPMISEAEAFVRHNAHHCVAPHHEKDYRVLQLFAPQFTQGRLLAVLRISSEGTLEVDVLRGTGAITSWGMAVIHKGHMCALPLPGTRIAELLEHFRPIGKVIRELDAHGWASFLEQGEGVGIIIIFKQHPCSRCRAGDATAASEHQLDWDLASFRTRLKDRPAFKHGLIGQAVELYADPLRMKDPQPEHDLTKAPVTQRLRDLAVAAPAPGVPNFWQFGSPCTTYCDFQLLHGGTHTFATPTDYGSRPDEQLGNEFADLSASVCELLFDHGREFAFESSAPSRRYPKIWDTPTALAKEDARIVCAWYLGVEEGTPPLPSQADWWLVSPGICPWARLRE